MQKHLLVAVEFGFETSFQRDLWEGIEEVALEEGWAVGQRDLPDKIRGWPFSGIIGAFSDPGRLASYRKLGLPLVDVTGICPVREVPVVSIDQTALGQFAAEHLAGGGARILSFYRSTEIHATTYDEVGRSIKKLCDGAGLEFAAPPTHRLDDRLNRDHHQQMVHWLRSHNKPLGIFAMDDESAVWLIGLCHIAGKEVPGDVTILGCGNDRLVCRMIQPTVSSICLPGVEVGRTAARVLCRLMRHVPQQQPALKDIYFPPIELVQRDSTFACSADAKALNAALQYIRTHVAEVFNIAELVETLGLNRRTLEQQCRKETGTSLLTQLHQIRVNQTKRLLLGADLSLEEVATRSGFTGTLQLRRAFTKLENIAPLTWRQRQQESGGK